MKKIADISMFELLGNSSLEGISSAQVNNEMHPVFNLDAADPYRPFTMKDVERYFWRTVLEQFYKDNANGATLGSPEAGPLVTRLALKEFNEVSSYLKTWDASQPWFLECELAYYLAKYGAEEYQSPECERILYEIENKLAQARMMDPAKRLKQ